MSPDPNEITFAGAFKFLLQAMRNKGAYGGRGSAKSWQFATALLIQAGGKVPMRIVCGRETQRSIADSVHALLSDRIRGVPAWGEFYKIQEHSIRGKNNSEFIFHGLRHNPAAIKSLEGADRLWIEEAQSVGADSWEMVIPTIRKPGSEIWASWNPRLETDPVHQRYVINPAPNTIAKKVSWRDNKWFPDELRIEMEHLKNTDYHAYLHVWEGDCQSAVEGAVYAAEIAATVNSQRITHVPVDRTQPVHTFWDLGYGDSTAIWMAQMLQSGQVRVVDYLENKGKTIEWYVIQLQQRGYLYGLDWLPHDGSDTIIHRKLGGDKSRSIEQLLRMAGRQPRIAAKMYIHEGINAVRTLFPSCWFDEDNCKQGLDALKLYQWGPPSKLGVEKREPLHDNASHGADAFRTLAVSIKQPIQPQPPRSSYREHFGEGGWMR